MLEDGKSLTGASSRSGATRRYKSARVGESSRCEDPAPTVGICRVAISQFTVFDKLNYCCFRKGSNSKGFGAVQPLILSITPETVGIPKSQENGEVHASPFSFTNY